MFALFQLGKLSDSDLEVEHGLGVGAYGTQGGGEREKLSGLQRENNRPFLAPQPNQYPVITLFVLRSLTLETNTY